jgi:hypothetical protein
MNPISVEEIASNSYRNYHAEGLDYLCLRRHPKETVKIYFFDGLVSHTPEVVSPHDHRYDFTTIVAAGKAQNNVFKLCDDSHEDAEHFHRFDWYTPLNGGGGFVYGERAFLRKATDVIYTPGMQFFSGNLVIHTLNVAEGTILIQKQFENVVPNHKPTSTYVRHEHAPSLGYLYSRMTEDDVCRRLSQLALMGFRFDLWVK